MGLLISIQAVRDKALLDQASRIREASNAAFLEFVKAAEIDIEAAIKSRTAFVPSPISSTVDILDSSLSDMWGRSR